MSQTSGQIQRWRLAPCPRVTGLAPAASAVVSRRVEEIARSVGAWTRGTDTNCSANVEVVFTNEPQQLLDRLAQAAFSGTARLPSAGGRHHFNRAIQAWYLAGTRSSVWVSASGWVA